MTELIRIKVAEPPYRPQLLTEKQWEAFYLLAYGATEHEVATSINGTVDFVKQEIYEALWTMGFEPSLMKADEVVITRQGARLEFKDVDHHFNRDFLPDQQFLLFALETLVAKGIAKRPTEPIFLLERRLEQAVSKRWQAEGVSEQWTNLRIRLK